MLLNEIFFRPALPHVALYIILTEHMLANYEKNKSRAAGAWLCEGPQLAPVFVEHLDDITPSFTEAEGCSYRIFDNRN